MNDDGQKTLVRLLSITALVAVALLAAVALRTSLFPGQDEAPELAEPMEVSSEARGTIELRASEFAFDPASIQVPGPGVYNLVFTNTGSIEHDVVFSDGTRLVAGAGETVRGTVTVAHSTLSFLCSIPGHQEAGMQGIIVAGTAPVEETEEADPAAAAQVAPDPDAPAYQLHDPRAPARGEGPGITLVQAGSGTGGDLIEVELVIQEKLMTVAEGYVQRVWTFGGTVPGPVIRARVGDTIRVHLRNPAESELSHSIDFHASQVAWNDEMLSIAPGEELVYEFQAEYAGVWMYHCGTAPVLHHIANGMYGMVIVEPAEGLALVEHEYALVQSEWYLGPQGEASSLTKANQGAPAPDFVMFNGVAFQYKDHPIEVPTGEEVRFIVLNAGPSMDSSFHIVGTIFDTVVKEGVVLLRGNAGTWGSQAVDLAPAQGAVIEFRTPEDGLYPIVTHAFNFPGRGALGLVQAGDGDPLN